MLQHLSFLRLISAAMAWPWATDKLWPTAMFTSAASRWPIHLARTSVPSCPPWTCEAALARSIAAHLLHTFASTPTCSGAAQHEHCKPLHLPLDANVTDCPHRR